MTPDPLSMQELRERLAGSPFVDFMKLEPVSFDARQQSLSLRIPFRPEFQRGSEPGRWHGGVIASLIDTAGDFVVIALCRHAPPTVNFRVDYLKPAVGRSLVATGSLRRQGRSMAFVDVDVLDENGVLVALGRANYSMTGHAPQETAR
jgi:uncharacterized protein (TIGR00369 family)